MVSLLNSHGTLPTAKAKRERLQAWRKEQETKKALEEARLRALNVAAAFGGESMMERTR